MTGGHYDEPHYAPGAACGWCKRPLSGAVRIFNPHGSPERIVHKECFDASVRIAHPKAGAVRYVCTKCGAVDDIRYERGGVKLCGRCDAPLKEATCTGAP
jgi:hypothetical protein